MSSDFIEWNHPFTGYEYSDQLFNELAREHESWKPNVALNVANKKPYQNIQDQERAEMVIDPTV